MLTEQQQSGSICLHIADRCNYTSKSTQGLPLHRDDRKKTLQKKQDKHFIASYEYLFFLWRCMEQNARKISQDKTKLYFINQSDSKRKEKWAKNKIVAKERTLAATEDLNQKCTIPSSPPSLSQQVKNGLEHKSQGEQLKELGLFRLEKAQERPYHTLQWCERRLWWGVGQPPLPGRSNSTRGNGLKLHHEMFRSDIRKNLFSQRAVRQWHSCPGRWRSYCPWRCSRTVWMWHWGMWSVGMVGVGWWLD